MENPTHAPEPAPETSEPQAVAPVSAPEEETDALIALAHAAKAARLAPAEEERAAALLKEQLTGGKAGITASIRPMLEGLPWIVCVNAVSAVWEQLSAPMRRHLLGSIAKDEGESARRLRLSLARAVFKLEPAAGLKLAAAAAADLKHPETGALTPRYRQFFFNVFIGKGKPWLLQLPLGELKAAEADALAHCAIECFPFCPPISQLSILRWVDGAGRLKKASATDLDIASKAVARWNTKLQRQLKKEIAELPAALEGVLKPEALKDEPEPTPAAGQEAKRTESRKAPRAPAAAAKDSGESGQESDHEAPEPAPEESPAPETPAPLEELVIPSRAERLAKKEEAKLSKKHPESRKSEAPEERRPERREERSEQRAERREERLERAEKAARPFDLKETLRAVESHVAALRSELEQSKTQLRRQEQEGKRGSRSTRSAAETPPPAEVEALIRHNARLEATVTDLRQQLDDLASHHESVAESCLLHTGEPLPEGATEQLKALLAIKLAESYETYEAMRLEPLDRVFRLDYRDLLGSVFDVLLDVGVRLKK